MLESFLIKLQACKFIEKRLQYWCFPLHVRKFLRTPIFKNISEQLLLIILLLKQFICFRLFLYNYKKKTMMVKKMFIEIRLCNRITHFFKEHVKVVKIYMVKFNRFVIFKPLSYCFEETIGFNQ